MPLGDADIASGVFFADFGVPVVFGGVTVQGLLDQRGQDAGFGTGPGKVSNVEYRLEIAANAFSPAPKGGDRINVNGVGYVVIGSDPLDDGAIIELQLRRS